MKVHLKTFTSIVLILTMLFFMSACGLNKASSMPAASTEITIDAETVPDSPGMKADSDIPHTRNFADSLGRIVELPEKIDRIAVSGFVAQIFLFALCPDKMVGVSTAWTSCAKEYISPKYFNLPVVGQLYGTSGELNPEALLVSGAQVVVEVGEPKDGIAEDMDDFQKQTGIPFVHISAATDTMGDAYRKLGELLDMHDEAETLAAYCDRVYSLTKNIAANADKVKLIYITGDKGLNVIAKSSYHSEVVDIFADNLAVLDNPSAKGTGNEVDMEQLLNWNPEYILFGPESVYSSIAGDPVWQNITAIKNGTYYEVPQGPYNWMGFPPSAQRLLGMMWIAKLLYPEAANFDLQAEVTEYYRMFYHCDLSPEQYNSLVENSIGK